MSGQARDWTGGEPRLVVHTCSRCRDTWYLPHEHCPVCGSPLAEQASADGSGLCVAVTRLLVTADDETSGAPVRLALVELDEGPLVMGRVHDDALMPGDRARADFRHDGHGGTLVPSFAREG
jgi:uncharacterized OB-fold protein